MGEVYRARDQRLQRDVALKLIKPASSSNPDHLRRFEQEARAAAALNHPNIVAIYDVGTDNGVPYIVSELLEGQTLRRLLSQGAVPARRAADYALQIAQGLMAAHDRHIVHRDLKPENLFVTNDGRVKILDFGVAKLQPTPQDAERSLATMTTVTKSGSVIGTVAYMSPEQLRGKAVDHRSDLFALGAVLYEVLAGRRAFRGETEVDTMTAVLREDPPPIQPDQSSIPPAFQQIVRHCLEKNPDDRFQSARDLAFALGTLTQPASEWTFPARGWRSVVRALPWAIAGLLLLTSVYLLRSARATATSPLYQRLTFEQGTVHSARFAPDGRAIVYGAAWNGKPLQIYSTVGDSLQVQPLALTDANLLAVSASNEIAVALHGVHMAHMETENGVLAVAPLAGGSPREVLEDVPWADWDSTGQLVVVHDAKGHYQIEYPVGHVLFESKGWISHLRFSPVAHSIAFIDHPALWDDRGSICILDTQGKDVGQEKELSSGWESAEGLAWSPRGDEVWFTAADRGSDRGLFAVNLSGKVRTVLHVPGGLTLQDVAPDGRVLITFNTARLALAATALGGRNFVDLSWHDWSIAKDISRDGRLVLFEDASEAVGPSYAVALRNIDGSLPVRLGDGSAGGLSPDGRWAISVSTDAPQHVTLLPIGPGQPRTLTVPGLEHIQNGAARFLPDGKRITVNGNEPGHLPRCYLVDLDGGTPKAITPERVVGGRVSPDGRYIYALTPGTEVVLYPMDGGPPKSIPGLQATFLAAQWSADSSALYGYVAGELPARVYRVEIATGKKTLVQALSPVVPAGVVSVAPVIVSQDGTRFAYSYSQVMSVLYEIKGLR